MGFTFFFVAAVVVAIFVLFVALVLRYRGDRIVTCPETRTPVGATINAALAAGSWIVAEPHFEISACSRWHERADCDQACASQIEAAPDGTLVRNIVAKWYGERPCAFCATPIVDIGFGAVAPALLSFDGALREWKDIAIEDLSSVLDHAVAVCARCELVEDFRRRFPDRGIDRPVTNARRHHFLVEGPSAAIY